jgi:transposase-like protein
MIEEMLAARGIVVSHKTVRQWALIEPAPVFLDQAA